MKRVIAIAAVLLLVSNAFGAERLVPSQYATIQSAIDAASPGDTVIISPGIYTGAGNYNISFSGKAITVRSIDPNDESVVESTVIDCNMLGRGFSIDASVILDGLTVTNGNTGGIYISAGAPLIRNCNISGNYSAGRGGGIYAAATVLVDNCKIVNNESASAGIAGGGLFFFA